MPNLDAGTHSAHDGRMPNLDAGTHSAHDARMPNLDPPTPSPTLSPTDPVPRGLLTLCRLPACWYACVRPFAPPPCTAHARGQGAGAHRPNRVPRAGAGAPNALQRMPSSLSSPALAPSRVCLQRTTLALLSLFSARVVMPASSIAPPWPCAMAVRPGHAPWPCACACRRCVQFEQALEFEQARASADSRRHRAHVRGKKHGQSDSDPS